jgi:hypothetical protein
MAHNLHYVIVTAESIDDAVDQVNDTVLEWQRDENNYFSILVCSSEDGKETKDFREPDGLDFSVPTNKAFKKCVAEIRRYASLFRLPYGDTDTDTNFTTSIEARMHLIAMLTDGTKYNSYMLTETLNIILSTEESHKYTGNKYPMYREYQFDKFGMTDMSEPQEGLKQYVVLIDMHS